jgi:hypothetical protein
MFLMPRPGVDGTPETPVGESQLNDHKKLNGAEFLINQAISGIPISLRHVHKANGPFF